MKNLFLILSITTISGCGSFVPIHDESDISDRAKNLSLNLPVVGAERLKNYNSIGNVVGYSCKNKIWDPDATIAEATHQVKIEAVNRGAIAITNLSCTEGSLSFSKNCWQSYICQATALK